MNITRRNLLRFTGGAAAGALLTPMPWKTLDDLAIWTQNGPWIPKPLRGEVKTRFTTCTLCPAACGVRARCVGPRPVALSGVAAHPVSRGSLCPVGLGGHHLSYHPARLLQPVHITRDGGAKAIPLTLDAAVEAVVRAAQEARAGGGKIAVLDQVPGRTLSRLYRGFLRSTGCGVYVSAPGDPSGPAALARLLREPWGEPGLDLDDTATLLSFGAPILDGWGSPGSFSQRRPKIIQVEPRRSRTAAAADLWLPLRPGTETSLALGIAHVLIGEKLVDEESIRARAGDFEGPASYKSLIGKYTPEYVSGVTGIDPARIAGVARGLARNAPAVVIGGGDPAGAPLSDAETTAVWGLNLLLGSVGRKGGIVARRAVPEDPALSQEELADIAPIAAVPDASIRLLILDSARSGSAVSWKLLEPKLVPGSAMVVALSPVLAGDALRADLIIPSPAYLEAWDEAPVPPHCPVSTFSISRPLLPMPDGIPEPAQLITRLRSALSLPPAAGGADCSAAACLKRKSQAIHESGRGGVFSPSDGQTTEMRSVDSAESLWTTLSDGGCWIDGRTEAERPPRFTLLGGGTSAYETLAAADDGHRAADGSASDYPIVLIPSGLRGALDDENASPLMTKLYQESGLRRLLNQADINPVTAAALGLSDRGDAVVETPSGSLRVEIRFDPGVMPGVIYVALGPSGIPSGGSELRDRRNVLDICRSGTGPAWRMTRAKVREA